MSMAKGKRMRTTGIPYLSHSVKVMSKFVATMAFGGVPTSVPIPPIFALKAMPKSTKT